MATTFLIHFSSATFQIETSYLICNANQMTGFYMKCNTAVKSGNSFVPFSLLTQEKS